MRGDLMPVCLSGSITKAPSLDISMDGATHLLHVAKQDSVRLKGANKSILEQLEHFTDAKCVVTVCGAFTFKAESKLFIVSWVGIKNDFLKKVQAAAFFDSITELPHGDT